MAENIAQEVTGIPKEEGPEETEEKSQASAEEPTKEAPSDTNKGYVYGIHQNYIVGAGAAVVVYFGLPIVAPTALAYVGFTSTGVAAGSVAAGVQAYIGNVAAGSAFATCTSWGMTGVTSATASAITGATAGVTVSGALNAKDLFQRKK